MTKTQLTAVQVESALKMFFETQGEREIISANAFGIYVEITQINKAGKRVTHYIDAYGNPCRW